MTSVPGVITTIIGGVMVALRYVLASWGDRSPQTGVRAREARLLIPSNGPGRAYTLRFAPNGIEFKAMNSTATEPASRTVGTYPRIARRDRNRTSYLHQIVSDSPSPTDFGSIVVEELRQSGPLSIIECEHPCHIGAHGRPGDIIDPGAATAF